MRRTLAVIGLLALGLGLPLVPRVAAQGVPNLSGTWNLVPDKSDFGPMPAPTRRTDVIVHQEPALTITRTATTPNGEATTTLVYAVDGQPHKNMAGQSEVTTTLHWESQVLVAVSTLETQNGPVTLTDRYTLSEDGKTLTQARVIQVQGQELTQTIVLERAG